MTEEYKPSIFARGYRWVRETSRWWWREAVGPIDWDYYSPRPLVVWRRIWHWVKVVIPAVIIFGGLGFYFFTGWRARDLAAKAISSVESGNLPLAKLQIMSAQSLRKSDPQVLLGVAVVETVVGSRESASRWAQLPPDLALTKKQLEQRATAMARFGSEDQYARALGALEGAGLKAEAASIRSARGLQRGDVHEAIAQARSAVEADASPQRKATLLQLLAVRYGPLLSMPGRASLQDLAAGKEMAEIIDALQGTPEGDAALLVGFRDLSPDADQRSRWAKAAWKNPAPSNPALLAASTVLVADGDTSVEEMRSRLEPIFSGANPAERAAWGAWILQHGPAALVLPAVPDSEARLNAMAFRVRSEALARLGHWQDMLDLAERSSNVPAYLRLVAQAQASRKMGQDTMAQRYMLDAIRAAVGDGAVVSAMQMADEMGERELADEELERLCGDPRLADGAFRLARDRFGRRGMFAKLDRAHAKALQAAPLAPSAQDFRRYKALLAGETVQPEQTASAVASEPSNVDFRITHALALLRAGQPDKASSAFDDLDVFVDRLPPGERAVVAAVIAARGDTVQANAVARSIDTNLLSKDEFALLAPCLSAPSP